MQDGTPRRHLRRLWLFDRPEAHRQKAAVLFGPLP
jgi:hypothetical protein